MSRRIFKGVTFICERPGRWISEDGKFGIYCMMAGTTSEQWEVYKRIKTDDPPLYGESIGLGLTMAEAIQDASLKGDE